jgi:hypothetical protein
LAAIFYFKVIKNHPKLTKGIIFVTLILLFYVIVFRR